MAYNKVFSEFEVKRTGLLFPQEDEARSIGAVGSLEEVAEVRQVIKKCEGIERKRIIRGSGAGTLNLNLHMVYDVFADVFGMKFSELKDGVYAYGADSVHPTFTLTCLVVDEDGVEKLRAYPNCVATTGFTRTVTNGAEEIAEMTQGYYFMPDEFDKGVYECIVSEAADDEADRVTLIEDWLTNWSYDLVR
jgi:hypothetical protein